MINDIFFHAHINEHIFYEIKKERTVVGYYDLPLTDITYLSRLDKFHQKHIVVVGIGGSSLGAKAVNTFLSYKKHTKRTLHFLETTDPITLKSALDQIDLNDSLFVIISKSGRTIETISIFKYILSLKPFNKQDFVFVTDMDSPLFKLGLQEGIETFYIAKNVGGRFSVLSSVGLIPLYLMGYDISELLRGARDIRNSFFDENTQIKESLLKKASFYAEHMLHYNINALFSYSELFRDFNAWYVQLWAESLGKKQLNSQLNVGLTPVGLIGPTDQHSFLQLIVEGPKDKTVTFLKIDNFNDTTKIPDKNLKYLESLNLLNNIEFAQLINMQADSIIENLKNRDVPLDIIQIDQASIYHIGELFYYYELLTSLTGKMLNVDTYGQPGVEEGKKILKTKLSTSISSLRFVAR
ncbi:MAG: glucose-6-phosphate isomerase [Epsilonproteobacteria bacterium]|nr:glucose-6-phosphate isomerase [Campylobacterota bacterium]